MAEKGPREQSLGGEKTVHVACLLRHKPYFGIIICERFLRTWDLFVVFTLYLCSEDMLIHLFFLTKVFPLPVYTFLCCEMMECLLTCTCVGGQRRERMLPSCAHLPKIVYISFVKVC